jgi:putative inorganic carbon (hco3(-)) transporter
MRSLPTRRNVAPAVARSATELSAQHSRSSLYAIRFGDIWAFLKRQPTSFWFINIYLFFEYVRPQNVYRGIDVLPWAWGFIYLTLAALVFEGMRLRRIYAADKMLAAFAAMVLISSFMAVNPADSWEEITLFFSWVLIYALITNTVNSEQRFLIFMLAFLVYSTKMSQHGARTFAERGGGFAKWGATGGSGWFSNSGEFGIQMCMFFPLSVYFINELRKHWPKWKLALFLFMPVSALVSIVASSSRGAVLGLVPAVGWMMLKSKKRVKAIVLTSVLAGAVWVLLPAEQKTRFSEMGEDETSQSRLTYWKRGLVAMEDYPLTGIGYRNWINWSVRRFGFDYGAGGKQMVQLPHNIFIEAGAELGLTGLALFFGLIGITLYTNYRTRKLAKMLGPPGGFTTAMAHGLDAAMIGYLAAGFFVTVLYYPFFWINLALTVSLHNAIVNRTRGLTKPPARTPMRARYGAA